MSRILESPSTELITFKDSQSLTKADAAECRRGETLDWSESLLRLGFWFAIGVVSLPTVLHAVFALASMMNVV